MLLENEGIGNKDVCSFGIVLDHVSFIAFPFLIIGLALFKLKDEKLINFRNRDIFFWLLLTDASVPGVAEMKAYKLNGVISYMNVFIMYSFELTFARCFIARVVIKSKLGNKDPSKVEYSFGSLKLEDTKSDKTFSGVKCNSLYLVDKIPT